MKLYFLAFVILFAEQVSFAKTKLRIGIWDYPPNLIVSTVHDKAEIKGAIYDVWSSIIAPHADLEIIWVGPLPFPRALQMLEEGTIDAVQHLSLTAERQSKFQFSKHPIMWGRQDIVVNKKEVLEKIENVEQLKGKNIGMIAQGYLAPFFLNNKSLINFEELSGIDSAQNNLKKLISNRIWGIYFTFPDVILYHANMMQINDQIKLIGFPGSDKDEVTYAAFSKRVSSKTIARIEQTIKTHLNREKYFKLIKKYNTTPSLRQLARLKLYLTNS